MEKPKLKELSELELIEFFTNIGEKPFRARQLMQWLYRHRIDSIDDIKSFSGDLKQKLMDRSEIAKLPILAKQTSRDGSATKLALEIGNKDIVECVALFDGKRRPACLSTQVGCKYGCAYCATGEMGFRRSLSQWEILGQLIALQDTTRERLTNIVFMGMGEPLDNLENVIRACDIIQSDHGFLIGGRKITISTCGIVPKIRALADRKTNIGLAISLSAPNDEIRNKLIPINKKYPIKTLLESSAYYFEKTGRRITFEYVLISDMNDSDDHIRELKDLLNPYKCKLNLIALNDKPQGTLKPTSRTRAGRIQKMLEDSRFTVTLRKSLGKDISAACGQLYQQLK